MLRRLGRLGPPLAIAGLATVLMCPSAQADPKPSDGSGEVYGGGGTDWMYVGAHEKESAPGQRGQSSASGAKHSSKSNDDKPKKKCTVEKMDPQPPADNLAWAGHKPGDADAGAIYTRTCVDTSGAVEMGNFWSKGAPPAAAVDPVDLARDAVDKMKLAGPDIGIVPKPGKQGLVGLPVWMWTEKTPETYGPNTATATAGAVTVTATARVSKIVWTMGDGHTVTCTSAGTPYKASYGKRRSPDCGYLYQHSSKDQPGQKYSVTATSTWTVDWNGAGQSGQITQTRQSQVQVTIGQLKVLN